VRSLAADPARPARVYLGTADGGIFRSDDAGRRWSRMEPGFPLPGMSLDNAVVDPEGRLVVGYWEVAGRGGGVAVSADGGASFEVLPGIAGESVRALAIAPSDARTLVAGTLNGVFLSSDAGASWRRVSPEGDRELRNIESVAVDPRDPRILYAGTWHLPWKSLDAGARWHPIHTGMIDDSDVFTLTIDRSQPDRVFATACTGIYSSSDAGRRWSKVRGIPSSSRRTRSLALGTRRSDAVYAGTTEGLWATLDGASWQRLTRPDLIVNSVVVLVDGTLLLGTEGAGVLRSDDGGQSFAESNQGFSAQFVTRLVRHPEGLVAALHGSRYHAGVLWAPAPEGPWRRWAAGLEGRRVLALAPWGSGLLAGTDLGVYLSEGRGRGWRPLPILLDGIEHQPGVRDLLALDGRLLVATDLGLLTSGDSGAHWSVQVLGASRRVSALARLADTAVLAATPLALYESRDAGATWQALPAALEGQVHALRPVPGLGLFALTADGVRRSDDGGRGWQPAGRGLPLSDVTGLTGDPEHGTLWASDFARGALYRSDDDGESWQPVATDGLRPPRVWDVVTDPAWPGRVVAATAGGGLHVRQYQAGRRATALPEAADGATAPRREEEP
jgi:photosystem II stability/assembly factor-like uncharacterized protein